MPTVSTGSPAYIVSRNSRATSFGRNTSIRKTIMISSGPYRSIVFNLLNNVICNDDDDDNDDDSLFDKVY